MCLESHIYLNSNLGYFRYSALLCDTVGAGSLISAHVLSWASHVSLGKRDSACAGALVQILESVEVVAVCV